MKYAIINAIKRERLMHLTLLVDGTSVSRAFDWIVGFGAVVVLRSEITGLKKLKADPAFGVLYNSCNGTNGSDPHPRTRALEDCIMDR